MQNSIPKMDNSQKYRNFENSRWRTSATLKIALSLYVNRELSDFDQIWYDDANFHSEDGHLTKKKSKFCKLKMADGRDIDKYNTKAVFIGNHDTQRSWSFQGKMVRSDQNGLVWSRFKVRQGRRK